MLTTQQVLRAGAGCAFASTVAVIATQIYGAIAYAHLGKDKLPDDLASKSADQQVEALLSFAQHHADLLIVTAILSAVSYALLLGPAAAFFLLLGGHRPRLATAALAIGSISAVVVTAGRIGEVTGWLHYPDRYARAATATAHHNVIHDFQSLFGLFQILEFVGNGGVAVWLGLLGFMLLRTLGTSNLSAWGTLGACLLLGTGLGVVLPVWTLGVGIGLLRQSSRGSLAATAPIRPSIQEPPQAPLAAPRETQAAQKRPVPRAQAGKRRKRR